MPREENSNKYFLKQPLNTNMIEGGISVTVRKIVVSFLKFLWKIVRLFRTEINSPPFRKILIVRMRSLGEMIMCAPLAKLVRHKNHDSQIVLLTAKNLQAFAEGGGFVDRVIGVNENVFMAYNVRELFRLIRMLRRERFDFSIMTHPNFLMNLFNSLIGAKLTVGFNWNNEGFFNSVSIPPMKGMPKVKQYLSLGCPENDEEWGYTTFPFYTLKDKEWADRFVAENSIMLNENLLIGVYGGGYKLPTRWPIERYIEVVKKIKEIYGGKFIFFGGESDKNLCDVISARFPEAFDLIGKLSLGKTQALMAKCTVIICNDSGGYHLAAATGKPVLAIFGPTDPEYLTHRNTVVVKRNLQCAPCRIEDPTVYPILFARECSYGKRCLEEINSDEVFSALRRLIEAHAQSFL